MSVLIVTCEALEQEVKALLPDKEACRLVVLGMGNHKKPKQLRHRLQKIIDREGDVEAVVVLYGYCGGVLNLEPRRVPVVVPKAHDCFDLMLGPKVRFAMFSEEPGTYFFSEGWARKDRTPEEKLQGLPQRYVQEEDLIASVYAGYRRMCFVRTGCETESSRVRAKRCCTAMNWMYEEHQAELIMIKKAITGIRDDDFILLNPGERTREAQERLMAGLQSQR
ncbi:MAG TPA: DUF1638 domain-containing protein [Nitrospirota bacterium]|nr:DUF1638 domain-containing protein [Nitrospirota bacterium]